MASCCRAVPCEGLFDERVARWDLKSYRWRGVSGASRKVLSLVPAQMIAGSRVLEVGGGIGALQAELLLKGASSGEVVELVQAYEPYARQLAAELGLEGRSRFLVADIIADPQAVEAAEIVLLDKVICCSGDGPELVRAASALTKSRLVLAFPRSNWLSRLLARGQRAVFRLFGHDYRFYVWPLDSVEAAAREAGLLKVQATKGFVWQYVAFERPET